MVFANNWQGPVIVFQRTTQTDGPGPRRPVCRAGPGAVLGWGSAYGTVEPGQSEMYVDGGCSSFLVKGGVAASDSQFESFDGERPAAVVVQGFFNRRP